MAVAMEFGVIIIYLVTGWMTSVISTSQRGTIASRPWKGNAGGPSSRPTGRGGNRQGPIHGLVGVAVAAAQQQSARRDGVGARSGMR